MRFDAPSLQHALQDWRQSPAITERASADNVWFEERVSDARRTEFEDASGVSHGAADLVRALCDYWAEFVKVDEEIPHTFLDHLGPAYLNDLDDTQPILRIESLTRPLAKYGISFAKLRAAWKARDMALVDAFLRTWNSSSARDWRPVFAAFKDELGETLNSDNWPTDLRNRLGLAHYDCSAGSVPIALMEYPVRYVKSVAAAVGLTNPFTAPTVLDTAPWPFFFPAPPQLSCGRTMSLFEVTDDSQLLSEMLHYRCPYRFEHILDLAEITDTLPNFDLRSLRNNHLFALQLASDCELFGEEIAQ